MQRRQQRGSPWRPGIVAALAIAALVFLEVSESRAEDWVTLTLASYHFERSRITWNADHSTTDHNERNWGLGLEHGLSAQWRLAAGAYRNSEYRTTAYLGGQWLPLQLRPMRAGVMPVIATGYMHGRVLVTFVPMLALEHRGFGANFFFVPQISGQPGVLALQLKYRFQ